MLKTVFGNIIRFVFRRQVNIFSAASIIMVTVFVSRLLGLIRDRFLVSYFPKEELGVYLAAFRLPNLIFELLVMGMLSTAFIPVFTKYLNKKDENESFDIATNIINVSSLIIIAFSVAFVIFAKTISRIFAPGFSDIEVSQMAFFTRIILVGQLLPLVIGNFLTGILQSYQRFIIPSLAPVVYNFGILLGIFFLSPTIGLLGPAIGVVIGAVFFLAIQVPFVFRLGYRYKFQFSFRHKGVKEVFRLMIPRTFGLGISQIDSTVDLMLASFLGAGSVTVFYFAQHLQQFPIGLFGSTVAQAALPALTAAVSKNDLDSFKKLFLASYHQILFFVLPFSAILLVLRIPIVRLIFGAPRFDWQGTIMTGQTLAFFTISLFAQSLVYLFARGFYAFHDTKTPVTVGMISVLINTFLSIFFVAYMDFGVWALALSTSISSIFNFLSLLAFLDKRIGFNRTMLFIPPLKMIVAAVIAGVFSYIPMKLFDQLVFDTSRTFELFLLTGVSTLSGLSGYLFFAWLFAIEEVMTFFNMARKIKRVPRLIFTSPEVMEGKESPVN